MNYIKSIPLHVDKQGLTTVLIIAMMVFSAVVSFAPDCDAIIFFHKPAYKGRIIDMETKEPIEGVVVVAVYRIDNIWGYPGGAGDEDIYAREVLTDKDGYFCIPSCNRLVGLNSKASYTNFIIYKPGYASYPEQRMQITPFQNCGPGWLFKGKIGTTTETNKVSYKNGVARILPEKVTITYGVVELPKLNTWDERDKAHSVPGTGDFDLPILDEMVNKEHGWLKQNKAWRRQ